MEWSPVYHAVPLLGWTDYAVETRTFEDGNLTDAVVLALALFSPLLGSALPVPVAALA